MDAEHELREIKTDVKDIDKRVTELSGDMHSIDKRTAVLEVGHQTIINSVDNLTTVSGDAHRTLDSLNIGTAELKQEHRTQNRLIILGVSIIGLVVAVIEYLTR